MQKEKNMGTWRSKYKRKNDEHMKAHVLKEKEKKERRKIAMFQNNKL